MSCRRYAMLRECEHVGVDPAEVDRLIHRLRSACAEADRLGLHVFAGAGTIDLRDHEGVVVASALAAIDGGDGGSMRGSDGLMRGEE